MPHELGSGSGTTRHGHPMHASPNEAASPPLSPSRLDLKLDSATARAINESETAIRSLSRLSAEHPHGRSFADACLHIESIANIKMTGKQAGIRQLFRKPFEGSAASRDKEPRLETLRNADASLAALRLGESPFVTSETFFEIHRQLLTGTTRDLHKGLLRAEKDPVGGSRYHVFGAPYHVAEPENIPALLSGLAQFCDDRTMPAIAQAALAHVQFITIHPFERANGKTARAIIPLVLRRRGLIEDIVPPLSLAFSISSHDYQRGIIATMALLQQDRPQAELLNPWLLYFSQCCTRAVKEAEALWTRYCDLKAQWLAKLNARPDSAASLVVNSVLGMPVFTVASAAAYIDRSFKRVAAATDDLMEAGVIRQITPGKRNRVFECDAVLDLYEHIPGFQ